MYADRYSRRTKFDPGSMGLALALNGTIVIGLIAFAAPHFVKPIEHTLIIDPIPLDPPPPPLDPPPPLPKEQHPELPRTTPIDTFPPIIDALPPENPKIVYDPPTAPTILGGGSGEGGLVTPVKPTPVIIGPQRDSRFTSNFQPDYPADERRAGREGHVVVRVLIGVDGRVKQVERVSAASDSFFEATERRALQKWRFKPGTRDGVPIETWDEVGVKFVLSDE